MTSVAPLTATSATTATTKNIIVDFTTGGTAGAVNVYWGGKEAKLKSGEKGQIDLTNADNQGKLDTIRTAYNAPAASGTVASLTPPTPADLLTTAKTAVETAAAAAAVPPVLAGAVGTPPTQAEAAAAEAWAGKVKTAILAVQAAAVAAGAGADVVAAADAAAADAATLAGIAVAAWTEGKYNQLIITPTGLSAALTELKNKLNATPLVWAEVKTAIGEVTAAIDTINSTAGGGRRKKRSLTHKRRNQKKRARKSMRH